MKKLLTICFYCILFVLCTVLTSQAATLTVTKVADTNDNVCDADCSLREAIFAAAASGDVIEFASPLFDTARTITLTGQLTVVKSLTVNGRGANLTTISGDNRFRVFQVDVGLTLNGLTVTGGKDDGIGNDAGGGIYNNGGILTINNSSVTGNNVGSPLNSYGGGIYNADNSSMTMFNSTVSSNNLDGRFNRGAGIYNAAGTNISITNSTVSGNSINGGRAGNSTNYGGGIFSDSSSTVSITNSTISFNTVRRGSAENLGGGIFNLGSTTITNSTIISNFVGNGASGFTRTNRGAGIFNSANISITNSTITNNSISEDTFGQSTNFGGGIFNNGGATALITNSTLSTNFISNGSMENQGGGIFDLGTTTIINVTMIYNSVTGTRATGGGIFKGGEMRVRNTIVSGNAATTDPNLAGTLNFGANNYINGDARLAGLENNGGGTQTHLLLADSPAINAGNNCVLTANGCGDGNPALTTDQRGSGFPRLQAVTVDIGAVESARGIVLNADGSGAGSLRQTINDATAGDTIYFDTAFFAVPRTIIGNYGSDKNLTIVGPGANLLTLDADNFGRVFTTGNGATVNVSGIRFTRGRAFSPDSAGGILIYQNSTLNATGIVVDNSTAFGGGGGIYVDGTLNLTDSTVEGNTANFAAGIFVAASRTATLTRSIVRSNTATNNSGGIGSNGTLNFYSSTLSGNTAPFGGGLSNGGFAVFANSTVSGNRANGKGGGIYNNGGNTLNFLNTTITNNQSDSFAGAGIWNENFSNPSTTVSARNSIIAANISGNGNPRDYVGGITDLGNNIINNANPGLAPLGNYGGTTPTHALLPDSPAINAASDCVLTANTCGITHSAFPNDQRGTNAPRKIGALVDIGAFEQNITFDRTSLPNGNQNIAYSQNLTASRLAGQFHDVNFAPFTFSIVPAAGQSLPPGLTLSSDGLISGIPTMAGLFTFTVKVTDIDGMSGASQYSTRVFGPTAAGVSISGRLLTQNGQGVRGAIVVLTDQNGSSRSFTSTSFGYFGFDDVTSGQTYVVSVVSKRYSFLAQVLTVSDDVTELNFIAQ